MATQEGSYKREDIIRFLGQLLEEIPEKMLVIWDGAPIHRSRAVKEWLAQGAARRILVERLPGYAPELNPDEGVWSYLKRVGMRDVATGAVAQGVLGGAETAEQASSAALLHQGSGFADSFTHL